MEPSRDSLLHLQEQMAAIRSDLAELRELVIALRQPLSPEASVPPARLEGSPATLLARRNAERLAGEVQRRTELHVDAELDTETDLLIDRLHDLALELGDSGQP
jgi:hypothetical protein